jgi:hypothetical protein
MTIKKYQPSWVAKYEKGVRNESVKQTVSEVKILTLSTVK